MSEILVTRSAAAEAAFGILAGMPLPADAANLHRRGSPTPAWAGPLAIAYRAAPGRLQLQAIGLRHATVASLLDELAAPPAGLHDDAGRRLARAFGDALRRFATAPERFAADAPAHAERRAAFEAEALADLVTLRAALWETTAGTPPPLTILDCPALGPAGRATVHAGRHVVAVSLAEGPEHALLQVLHEQIHPVTDPLVEDLHRDDPTPRDTAVGTTGFECHAKLERLALDVGDALVAARTPHRHPAYRRWADRFV